MKTKKINNLQKFSIYIVLIVLFVACSIISPYFLQYSNLINVTRQLCVGILIAYGEMLLIISGFLDLSVLYLHWQVFILYLFTKRQTLFYLHLS